MDRTLTLFKPSGHKVAELTFNYDHERWADVHIAEFGQLYDDDDPNDESKSVYDGYQRDEQLYSYQLLDSMEKVRAFDRQYVQQQLRHQLTLPLDRYRFEYAADPVLLRYLLSTPRELVGIVDIRFSVADNAKHVAYRSGRAPRNDMSLELTALDPAFACMKQAMVFEDMEPAFCDIKRLPPWY
jgi:hypothetical protein